MKQKNLLRRLLIREFHSMPDEPWTEEDMFIIIDTTFGLGLKDEAEEMKRNLSEQKRKRYESRSSDLQN